jgi:hypothetical protein
MSMVNIRRYLARNVLVDQFQTSVYSWQVAALLPRDGQTRH